MALDKTTAWVFDLDPYISREFQLYSRHGATETKTEIICLLSMS